MVYEVTYPTPDGAAREYLVATTAEVEGRVATLTREGLSVSVWRHPDDPRLPGLPAACDPATVAAWLGAAPGEVADLETVGYRPLRRAVLRARLGSTTAFVKVVRPEKSPPLVERQRLLDNAVLGPRLVTVPAAGVIVTQACEGLSLARTLVDAASGGPLPSPESLVALLDRLPAEALALRERPAWSARASFHGAAAAAVLPERANQVASLVGAIDTLLAVAPVGPRVPTHGDFYEANIFVTDGVPACLIDVDSVGPGLREDDLATLLGHLAVLPDLAPTQYPHVAAITERWCEAFEAMVDPTALRVRVAAVILSLIAGTTRDHALERLALSQEWLRRA